MQAIYGTLFVAFLPLIALIVLSGGVIYRLARERRRRQWLRGAIHGPYPEP